MLYSCLFNDCLNVLCIALTNKDRKEIKYFYLRDLLTVEPVNIGIFLMCNWTQKETFYEHNPTYYVSCCISCLRVHIDLHCEFSK